MSESLFVYGTLLDEKTTMGLTGRRYRGENDILENHYVTMIADIADGVKYPAAIRSKSGGFISGRVIRVTKQELEKFDDYEGPRAMYEKN